MSIMGVDQGVRDVAEVGPGATSHRGAVSFYNLFEAWMRAGFRRYKFNYLDGAPS